MKKVVRLILGLSLSASLASRSAAASAPATTPTLAEAKPSPPPKPLSAETLAQIARMTSLFDGKTLDGWIQAPAAPLSFSSNDLVDLPALVLKFREKSDALSRFLSEQLDVEAQKALAAATPPFTNAKELTAVLVKNLNRLIAEKSLYDAARFQGVQFRPATQALLQKQPAGPTLMRLNHLLLEDAYPKELAASPSACWIVKDGVIASTGGGRGVIYTQADYGRYRIILTVRHVAGNPDHKPGILVFCTRPAAGEKGLDALGGIQFQTPTGSHWDYRPGHNNSGTGFTNPTKTTFDFHAWHQVEILVDATKGTARMAVAQPVGTRSIENADFADPAAGQVGPIALQMHNAGLFDEYKDIKIEINPTEDRLITAQ